MLGLRPEMMAQNPSIGSSADTAILELALQKAAMALEPDLPVEILPANLENGQRLFRLESGLSNGNEKNFSEAESRSLYHRGLITEQQLSDALGRLGFLEGRELILPGLTRFTLDHALLTRTDQRTDTSLRDWVLGLPWSEQANNPLDDSWPLGEWCRQHHDPLATRAVRTVLLPNCVMFFQNANPENNFWDLFLSNVSIGGIRTSFGKALEADACRRLGNRVGSAETALELLGVDDPSLPNLEKAVRLTLQAHPGWAARFRDAKTQTKSLMDFLGAVALVEFHIAADLALRSGHLATKASPTAATLARSLRQFPSSGEMALEIQREPWELCLALQHLGYSRQILEALVSPESGRELVRTTRALSPWKRQAIWREAVSEANQAPEQLGKTGSNEDMPANPKGKKTPPPKSISPTQPLVAKDTPVAMRVLLVEDDPLIGKAVTKGLIESAHTCLWVKNGKAGLDECMTQRHDCVILDLMLPEVAGLDVLRQVRAKGVRTPVVILTALGAVEERVAGLRDGADDYLVKPFAFHELLARLEAVRRRASNRPAPALQVGKLTLDLTNRRVTCLGNQVDLTPTGFSLLEILMRNAGNIVTRRMLSEHLWEGDCESETNIIEVHVNRLRNKLSRAGAGDVIQTVRGRGYTLKPF